jgi:hypothetical protein
MRKDQISNTFPHGLRIQIMTSESKITSKASGSTARNGRAGGRPGIGEAELLASDLR